MNLLPKSTVLRRFGLSYFLLESQFWFPVWMLFLSIRGFDLTTMVLADGVFRFTMVALEFPLGVLSDRIGRKKTYILINILALLTYIGIVLTYGKLMLFSTWILWGIFWSLSSGASSAYIFELIQEDEKEKENPFKVFGFMRAVSSAAALFSHLLAGILFYYTPELPFIVNGIFVIGALLIALTLPDISKKEKGNLSKGYKSLKTFFAHSYSNNSSILVGSILMALGLIYFWSPRIIIQPLFLELEISSTYIGLVYFFYSLAGVLGGILASRFRDHLGNQVSIFMGLFITWLGVLLVGIVPGKGALLFIPLMSFGFYISNTLQEVLLHYEVDNQYRASIFSAISFMGGIFIIFTRPGLGILADMQNSSYAFFIWAIIGVLFLMVYWLLIKKLPVGKNQKN